MKRPRPDEADRYALAGAALLTAGLWGLYGWPVAAAVIGSLLIVSATVKELRP